MELFFFLYFPALQNPEALKHKKEREEKLTARVHRSSTNRQGDIELAVFFFLFINIFAFLSFLFNVLFAGGPAFRIKLEASFSVFPSLTAN